jgi:hypothetical protein
MDFEKRLRAAVTLQLRKTADLAGSGAAAAAVLGRELKTPPLFGGLPPAQAIEAGCAGALGALTLESADLCAGSMALLQTALEAGQDAGLLPSDALTAAMKGIARIAALAPSDQSAGLRDRLEQTYQGSGEVFDSLIRGG